MTIRANAMDVSLGLDVGTPTFTWPEAVHPRLGGGCMGDGHHGWAAADFLSLVRNLLVREAGPGTLALCTMLPEGWAGEALGVVDAPTHLGVLSYAVEWRRGRPRLQWELRPHDDVTESERLPARPWSRSRLEYAAAGGRRGAGPGRGTVGVMRPGSLRDRPFRTGAGRGRAVGPRLRPRAGRTAWSSWPSSCRGRRRLWSGRRRGAPCHLRRDPVPRGDPRRNAVGARCCKRNLGARGPPTSGRSRRSGTPRAPYRHRAVIAYAPYRAAGHEGTQREAAALGDRRAKLLRLAGA